MAPQVLDYSGQEKTQSFVNQAAEKNGEHQDFLRRRETGRDFS